MARRLLSANDLLVPTPQASLRDSVRTEARDAALLEINRRWVAPPAGPQGLLDWSDQDALMQEIAFVNKAQALLDEAAVKIAPTVLRIVLTVKANLADARDQRAFLARHLELDFRRISELCIVAESYGLMDVRRRDGGLAEIERYGWSKALKLAHVPEVQERRLVWETACGGKPAASYRDVLDAIARFRERKQLNAPQRSGPLETRLQTARERFTAFAASAQHLATREDFADALTELTQVQRELNRLKRSLQEHMEMAQWEDLAAAT